MLIIRASITATLLALLFAVLISPDGSIVHAASPCGCGDISNLNRRIQEEDAAIAEYKIEITHQDPNEMVNDTNYAGTQALVQTAINIASYSEPSINLGNMPGQRGPAATNGGCQILISPTASPCMAHILTTHEQVHADKCNSVKSWGNVTSWQKTMTLVQFMQNEIDAYNSEKAEVKAVLSGLQSCNTQPQASINLPVISDLIQLGARPAGTAP